MGASSAGFKSDLPAARDPAGFAAFVQQTLPEIDRLPQLAPGYEGRLPAAAQPRAHRGEITRVAAAPAPVRGKRKQ